jgi:ABC-type cobalamin/Fe3+-siderophores transport system ATPase subunit
LIHKPADMLYLVANSLFSMESSLFNLAAQGLSLHSGTRTLIDMLDLTLKPGEVLGILGANGTGKSTLLMVLAGLAAPATGQVTLDGHALESLPPLVRAQHIGLLPQSDEGGFFGSVRDFVALGRYPFDGVRKDIDSHFVIWELVELAGRPLDTLSGGERQRARLAQLGVQTPQVYLLDEPLTHLDPAHQGRLLAWARSEADAGKSIVLTLHDPNWAACHCDRLLFLFGDGRWQIGTPETMLNPASLEALYGPGSAALWQAR